LPDSFVRVPGTFAARAIVVADASTARAARTITFGHPHAAFAAPTKARAGPRAACAAPAKASTNATTAIATVHGSLTRKPTSKNSLEYWCTSWHTLCFPSSRPAAGRETRWTFSIIAAEWRPTTARPKGGRSVV
jgi:hypothetical protein